MSSLTNKATDEDSSQQQIEELGGSELGTKEYWEKNYISEIKNYKSHGDVGEVWFDEDSQFRVITWLLKQDDIPDDVSIIDLGCGNGMMLIELAREGYKNLTGIDYSPKAIELASQIGKDQDLNIQYKVADLLNLESVKSLGKFRVIHDKGTYDAISLHPENPKGNRELYIRHVHGMLDGDVDNDNDTSGAGLLIITSCNWTEMELLESFKGWFEKYATIPAPTFMFGGKVGSVVTSLVFRKCSTQTSSTTL